MSEPKSFFFNFPIFYTKELFEIVSWKDRKYIFFAAQPNIFVAFRAKTQNCRVKNFLRASREDFRKSL